MVIAQAPPHIGGAVEPDIQMVGRQPHPALRPGNDAAAHHLDEDQRAEKPYTAHSSKKDKNRSCVQPATNPGDQGPPHCRSPCRTRLLPGPRVLLRPAMNPTAAPIDGAWIHLHDNAVPNAGGQDRAHPFVLLLHGI